MSTQELFDSKVGDCATEDEKSQLWSLLIRFCQEHTAIGHINLLPEWLSDYVKYDNPKALPQFFADNANLHTLRACLGMYPDEDIVDKSKIPGAIA